jgi:hypothetical protein
LPKQSNAASVTRHCNVWSDAARRGLDLIPGQSDREILWFDLALARAGMTGFCQLEIDR